MKPVGAAGSGRHRAVTLVEAVLYIAAALVLIVGGLVFYQQASLSARVNNQVRVLSSMMVEIRSLFATTGWRVNTIPSNLGGSVFVLDDVLIAAGSVPSSIVNPNPAPPAWFRLRNEWDGEMQLVTFYDNATKGNVLEVVLVDVPVNACVRLAPKDASGRGTFTDGVLDITVSSGPTSISLPRGTAVTPGDASTACKSVAPSSGKVTMSFSFTIQV